VPGILVSARLEMTTPTEGYDMNQDPLHADRCESGDARQDATLCAGTCIQVDADPGAEGNAHDCTCLETEAPVTCLAAYGYEVPDDGMMHGVPTRD
jgi:hypothetical protein